MDCRSEIATAVARYQAHADMAQLLARLQAIAQSATPEEIIEGAEPFLEMPEVVGPLYEHVVIARPDDARALVVLANAYWLAGRGPDVVGELASRAIAADPEHRGAWHLWALTESSPRERVARWRQICERFPADELARVLLADNAASLAGAEHDEEALALAITTYESLLPQTTMPAQRQALETAIGTLRGWRL